MADETQASRLEALAQKYHITPGAPTQTTYKAFDSGATYATDKERLQRISQAPKSGKLTTGDIHAEMAGIQMELAELAEEYGKLNVEFSTLLGKDKVYSVKDLARIVYNSVVRDQKAVREVKLDAVKRKGDAIELLVNKMAEVLGDQYQKAVKGKARAESMQVENIGHMKTLDRRLIESLRSGYGSGADRAAADLEVVKLERELSDIESVLLGYENDVRAAQAEGNIEKVSKITGEMSQVLDIKHQVLDGRLAAEGVVSEIRRSILDSAEGVQSAKGAIAASKVNYQAINALIDSYSELEIKYRHAQADMIPVFQIQAQVASGGLQALELRDTLVKVANASQKLMEANARMVTHLAAETFELLQTPLYDPARAQKVEEDLRAFMADLNAKKMEWAEMQTTVQTMPTSAHYAKPQ